MRPGQIVDSRGLADLKQARVDEDVDPEALLVENDARHIGQQPAALPGIGSGGAHLVGIAGQIIAGKTGVHQAGIGQLRQQRHHFVGIVELQRAGPIGCGHFAKLAITEINIDQRLLRSGQAVEACGRGDCNAAWLCRFCRPGHGRPRRQSNGKRQRPGSAMRRA